MKVTKEESKHLEENLEEGTVQKIQKVQIKTDNEFLGIVKIMRNVALASLIGITPFIVCNLYFAYNDLSCTTQDIPMTITLQTNLAVSGILGVIFIVSALTSCFFTRNLIKTEFNACVLYTTFYCGIVSAVFFEIWQIVGAVIFWKYTEIGKCSDAATNYIWAELIITLVGTLLHFLELTQK